VADDARYYGFSHIFYQYVSAIFDHKSHCAIVLHKVFGKPSRYFISG